MNIAFEQSADKTVGRIARIDIFDKDIHGMEQQAYRFDDVRGSLIFSESKIELGMNKGETVSGSFSAEEQNGLIMEGYVYSSSFRMHIDNPEINGDNIDISYTFDSHGMNAGDVLKGNFNFVTNRGEFLLPFVVMIQKECITSSMGTIKNLFHFANLAKSEWNEAVDVFYNPNFEDILTGNDARYRSLYRALTVKGNKNCNLEEFLIGINKKQKIEYIVDEDFLQWVNPGDATATVKIERNGWGYSLMAVRVIGDFIKTDKERITNSDFENDVCYLQVTVDPQALHSGKNPGKIVLKTVYEEKEIMVEAVKNTFSKKTALTHRKKVKFSLTRFYIDYTVKKINIDKWLSMTDELLTHRVDIDDDDLANSLMQVHSLIMQERFNEAKWILDKRVRNRIEEANNELYCYYLYMNALYSADDYYTKDIVDQIQSIYNNDRGNWRIAWILMKISDDLRKSVSKRLAFALEQISMGCTSPIIYLEALKAMSESPALLMHMNPEEKKVILFGAREGILTKDVMAQVSYVIMKCKNYDPTFVRIMRHIYEKTGSDESLQAICVQLMKGGKVGTEYYSWYSEAVERNFPLTKLYEAYMMSMDLRKDEPIPKRVLMYFSFQSELPPKQNAYLYAYIVKNMDSIQDIYLACKESIDRFVIKQLYAGRIDRNLAYLYSRIVLEEMATEDNMKQFATVVFKHAITVEDPNCVNVVVVDDRLREEKVYPIAGGCAYVALLGNEYTILLEDSIGNRFFTTKQYQTERFFMPGRVLGRMDNYNIDSVEYNLFISEDWPEFLTVTDQTYDRYRYLEKCDKVVDSYRGMLKMPLIRYCMEKDDSATVDDLLKSVQYDDIGYKDYNELIRTMLIRGLYDLAKEFVIYYGPENIEPKILVRITGRLLEREGCVESDAMTYMLMSAFERGKYDGAGLEYLARFYKGPVKILRNIWKAAVNFYIDTYEICERIILQTLKTGAFIGEEAEVLRQYVENGARTEVEMHYLSYFAHEYFVKGRPLDDYIFEEIERLYNMDETVTEVCMLAWLTYIAQLRKKGTAIDDGQIGVVQNFIWQLVIKQGIVFPFIAEFKDISAVAAQISNKTMVEYRGTPETKTVINYFISKDGAESEGYSREDMSDMYGGIYVKSFLLFFGESLQYYITEEKDGEPQFTESETVSITETLGDSNSDRYTLVNDIAVADSLKDYETTARLLEEYKYKEYLVNNIFVSQ